MSSQHLYVEDASIKTSPKVVAGTASSVLTMIVLFVLGQIPWVASWPESISYPVFGIVTAGVGALAAWWKEDAARYVENHLPASILGLIDPAQVDDFLERATSSVAAYTQAAIFDHAQARQHYENAAKQYQDYLASQEGDAGADKSEGDDDAVPDIPHATLPMDVT